MSLPLLEGLWRQPAASEQILKEALNRYNAAKRIAKWFVSRRDTSPPTEPRCKKRRISRSAEVSLSSQPISYEHWLFRALDSPKLAVRQMAARIMLRHKPPVDVILDHLRISVSSVPSPGDLQCFGLLTELSGVHLRTWKWAGSELKRLACHSTVNATRLVLLIHYLHATSQVVERGDGACSHFYDYLWSSRSLMSDLIAAHVMLLERLPARGLHVASQLLAKLVHPNSTSASSTSTKIRSESEDLAVNATNATNAAKRQLLRLDTRHVRKTAEEEDEDDDEMEDVEEEEDEDDNDPNYQQIISAEADDGESDNDGDEEDNEDDDEDGDGEIDEDHNDAQENDVDMTEVERDMVDVVRHFEERLLEINDDGPDNTRPSSSTLEREVTMSAPIDAKRGAFFLQACLHLMNSQYCGTHVLSTKAEQRLLLTICNVIQPPKMPHNLKIFLRRAPTQEEFFRGSLRNPIQLSQLSTSQQEEPTVRHFRQYIAEKLQMSETAELIELLCLNKILHLDLKLRVVQQVLWKTHLLENSSNTLASGISAPTFFSTGSGLSMVFSSDRTDRRFGVNADTPASALPPMVVTYRLAGVDGEATEDLVETLIDPEAPLNCANMSAEEQARLMENEFGLTRLVTDGRGVSVLLRSLQAHIKDSLRRIRRDDVAFFKSGRGKRSEINPSLAKFEKSSPCAGLVLLKLCTKLPSNCKKLVDARAPTILLRLLLDVLNAIDDSSISEKADSSPDLNAQIVSNPTAVLLEELIETVASDISTDAETAHYDVEVDGGSNTLPLLLSSLKTIYLGPQLRKVIAKLLPFLTYGLLSLARELAQNFELHVKVDKLSDCEAKEQPKTRRFVLMETFVQAAICLPPNDVCHSLRSELVKCGFVEKLIRFVLEDMPNQPPPWSAALWPKVSKKEDVADLEQSWKYYFLRSGIKTALDMLVGLCRRHNGVQELLATYNDGRFTTACHWIESTSDYKGVRVCLNGLGLLAETLLDEVKEDNADVTKIVGAIRRKTQERKKEISDDRRSKALVSMSSFGPPVVVADQRSPIETRSGVGDAIRSSASNFLAPVLGFFNPNSHGVDSKNAGQPAWMAEMEALEDETGLTCAVCQEGRTLQPAEVLGLYCFVKKVAIAPNKWGTRSSIDGAELLMNLPSSLPTSLVGTRVEYKWFLFAKSTGDSLRRSNSLYSTGLSVGSNQRPTHVTTTVSAGNAIHCSCHSKALSADRNHPKAPKSEWEGASLRNSRVNCNVILPLVSSKSSKVRLVAVDMALTEYQTTIANLLGARPKAILWAVLNDVRLLLLRMAYGESLSADCGGGSMSSNASLLFYQLLLVDMFTNDAAHDSPQTANHATCLSGGFLAAYKIVKAEDYEGTGRSSHASLYRSIADAAPMAALTCIVYHNTEDDESSTESDKNAMIPHPKRRWELNKEEFLCGLIACAGRRQALGVEGSGCHTNRKNRSRNSSFSDWENVDGDNAEIEPPNASAGTKRKAPASATLAKRGLLMIDDFANALRPMISLYAILNFVSCLYVPNMTEEMIKDSADVLVKQIDECQQAKGIHDLLRKAGVKLDSDRMMEELQKGMASV